MFMNVSKVVPSDERKFLLGFIDEIVAGNEMETPGAELLGVVEL